MPVDLAVIPVAGHGTRLLPATKSQPKEMLPVARKPVVQYVIEELKLNGIQRSLFITSHGKSSLEQHFDIDENLIAYLRESGREEQLGQLDFEREDMKYFYTRQRGQLGLGHAILCAEPLVKRQPFVVALGDSIIGLHAQSDIVRRMVDEFERSSADVVVAFEEVPTSEVHHYGIAQPRGEADAVFELEDVVEKPTPGEAPSNLAVAARYVFNPVIFEHLAETPPGKGGEIQLTDAMRRLLQAGGKGVGLRLAPHERRFDIGNFESYFRAFIEFALSDPFCGKQMRDFVRDLLAARHEDEAVEVVRTKAFSRIGLLGNPSDGYNGKTLSFTLRDFCAEVILYPWERLELIPSQEDHSRFGSIHELASDVELHGYYGGIRLLKATIKRFVDYCQQQGHELHTRNFSIRYESNIPRQVGMAGSSAIVVATLRALIEFYGVDVPQDIQASLALSVETKELGIAAGLQDRVAQVYDNLVYMDFSHEHMVQRHGYQCGRYTVLDPSLLPPLYIAYRADASEPTEVLHNHLRERYSRGDDDVVSAMQRFAGFAEQGRDLLMDDKADGLGELIDANFDLRQTICQLPESHLQMIQVARTAGATAKFAGSGGAIVGTYRDPDCYARLQHDLTEIGCRVMTADTARPTTEAS